MRRPGRFKWSGGAFLAIAALVVPAYASEAAAQLHPYEPLEWSLFRERRAAVAYFGAALFFDQRASLAGQAGSLYELGRLGGAIRTGRIVLSAEGTAFRALRDPDRFAEPYGDADADGKLADAGDFLVSTAVRLTPDDAPVTATLRFGTRLPTTDNQVGLERDATDFFAFFGGAGERRGVRASAEMGVGIHGTREPAYEQSDVFVYLVGLEFVDAPGRPSVLLLGHADGLSDRAIRGSEELAQLRLRLRSAGDVWIRGEVSRGLTPFTGAWGLIASVGRSW